MSASTPWPGFARLFTAFDTPTLVVMSQVYVPDPAAVGQYMHEVAAAMAQRGMRVIVLAADRGYDDPSRRHARYEQLDGVHIVRLPWSSFGKRSLSSRLAGGGIFTCEAAAIAASLPRIDHILVSTSPPMCALAGLTVSQLRSAPLSFWAMDINPDQILSTGRLRANALPVRAFDWLNRRTLERAHQIITLDHFMAERLRAKAPTAARLRVLPLWPLIPTGSSEPQAGESFRRAHGFADKRVLMYSGNLSPVHPIDTLLRAASELRSDPRLLWVFIGGGLERAALARYAREHDLSNLRFLPYQPLARLSESLAAADAHLVAMGEAMVGIVHPSKIYSAMAAARPIFALGPERSHVAALVRKHDLGWHVEHGDIPGALTALRELAAADPQEIAAFGERSRRVIETCYNKSDLLGRLCSWLGAPVSAA
jgi:colanic acid biosynthesis glycosyl transferase WcaI